MHTIQYLLSYCISLLAIASCPSSGSAGAEDSGVAATPVPIGLKIVTPAFERPVYAISDPVNAGRLFVLEQRGTVTIVVNGTAMPEPLVDISPQIEFGGERGLYSLAFDPRFFKNRRFYLFYFSVDRHTIVSRFRISKNDPNRINAGEEKIILDIVQPFSNHNGGQLQFGPDGYLYIGTGDGGSQGDPRGYAQNLGTYLGKMLRLHVRRLPAQVPPSNPFIKTPGAVHAIWAYGLRNPWRFSFDRLTGDLWITDVGQNSVEEINFIPATHGGGINFGWNVLEGDQCYQPDSGCDRTGKWVPVHTYTHDVGASITGGYVYRGSAMPALKGHYFFADIMSRRIWSFRLANGVKTQFTDWTDMLRMPDGSGVTPSSFGEDADGELYIVDYYSGHVLKIVPR